MGRIGHCILALLVSCAGLLGQSFEVASIRLHDQRGGPTGISTSGPRLTASAKTIAGLIMYAWDLKAWQIPETPALRPFGDSFYDIMAKAEGDAIPTNVGLRQMMQSLLITRFALKFHREMRHIPVYALVVDKNGLKLRPSNPNADSVPHWSVQGRNWQVTQAKASLSDLTRVLENSLPDRPIVDQTGLEGTWRISLTFTPNIPSNRGGFDPDDIDIFTAVRKLGLRLEARNAKSEVLVVDSVQKPTEN